MKMDTHNKLNDHEEDLIRMVGQRGVRIDNEELHTSIARLPESYGRVALQYIGDPSTEPPTHPQTIESIALERNTAPLRIQDSLRQVAGEIAAQVNYKRISEHRNSIQGSEEAQKLGGSTITAYSHWSAQGLCNGENSHLFITNSRYETHDVKHDRIKQAKAICERCPVRDPCLQEALDNGGSTVGVYGGTTEHERRDMLRKISRSRMRGRS